MCSLLWQHGKSSSYIQTTTTNDYRGEEHLLGTTGGGTSPPPVATTLQIVFYFFSWSFVPDGSPGRRISGSRKTNLTHSHELSISYSPVEGKTGSLTQTLNTLLADVPNTELLTWYRHSEATLVHYSRSQRQVVVMLGRHNIYSMTPASQTEIRHHPDRLMSCKHIIHTQYFAVASVV